MLESVLAMGVESGSLVGTTLGGVYRVRRLLGRGGMGEVYAAEGKDGERVAIKVLHDRAAQDPDLVARFQREAAIAAQIKSPYVAEVRGAGKDRGGRLWIAFERLRGEGLDVRLHREHYLPFGEVSPIVEDALQGLFAAHSAGVIHRDIKPGNLFIETRKLSQAEIDAGEPQERTRILDFGVSKMRARPSRRKEPSLTAIDATLGSFAYMAPEQVRGSARVDERADLYALGVVGFRALSGRLPFEGHSPTALLALKLDRDPPTLRAATGEEWPAVIERFIARILARDRELRILSAAEARAEWVKVCRSMGTRGSPRMRMPSFIVEPDDVTEVTDAPLHVGKPTKR